MDEHKKFDQICRICTDESEGTNIFSEEGKKYNLEGKIRKYLYISVYVEDTLPKMVCSNCKNKLDNVHQFATMAVKMQEKLKSYAKMKVEVPPDTASESKEEDEDEEQHGGSLLHSILTKGQSCSNGSSSPVPEITEVEVRVDPMLFLCDDISNDIEQSSEPPIAVVDSTDSEIKSDSKIKAQSELFSNSHHRPPPPPPAPPHTIKELKPYQCTIPNCPRGFNTEIGLQNHLWGHSHLPRKVLTTSDFNSKRRRSKRTVFLSSSINHADNTDESDDQLGSSNQSFACPMCGKKISTKGNLKVHLETHRPKGKYACDICGRIFKTQSNLYRHKEYHGGVQYPCQVCGRVYPTNSTLRAHSITHSNLRPHKCPLCDKTFKRNQDLKFHINQHTGARPYQCPYCPKAFASSGNCFSHRKRMHPTEVERDREMADEIIR